MVNESKVKLMTKLALYEETQGKEDFKISEYYRKDYTGMHILSSVFWTTVGYACIVALAALAGLSFLMDNMSLQLVFIIAAAAVIGYFAIVIIYAVITGLVCNKKHKDARQRVKRYNHDLTRLLKMYEKENR